MLAHAGSRGGTCMRSTHKPQEINTIHRGAYECHNDTTFFSYEEAMMSFKLNIIAYLCYIDLIPDGDC